MKHVVLGLIWLCLTQALWAVTPLGAIEGLLEKPNVLCGDFKQTKHLVGLKNPLISTGRFCVVATQGVLWRTLQPFPSMLRLTQDELLSLQDNQVVMKLDAHQTPGVQVMNNVLFALLRGDFAQLEKWFEIKGDHHGNNWQAALTAHDVALNQVIEHVQLSGERYVHQVVMREKSGDLTQIDFSSLVSGAAAMSDDEAVFFE